MSTATMPHRIRSGTGLNRERLCKLHLEKYRRNRETEIQVHPALRDRGSLLQPLRYPNLNLLRANRTTRTPCFAAGDAWPEKETEATLQPLNLLPQLHFLVLVGWTLIIATTIIVSFPRSRPKAHHNRSRRHIQRQSLHSPSAPFNRLLSEQSASHLQESHSRCSSGGAMTLISAEETPLHLAYVACKEIASPSPRKPHQIFSAS